ncbi:hypothetical protein RJT34_21532 [Clitoria ternatea]|uniref:Uncharacterized protein n=1 Tax=Clitoria ternatea TaxID=43366 RepID=A0AAN9P664_CLITE
MVLKKTKSSLKTNEEDIPNIKVPHVKSGPSTSSIEKPRSKSIFKRQRIMKEDESIAKKKPPKSVEAEKVEVPEKRSTKAGISIEDPPTIESYESEDDKPIGKALLKGRDLQPP